MNRPSLIDLAEETAALGAALLDGKQAAQLLADGRQDDFAHAAHRTIFLAMQNLTIPFDYAAVSGELQRRGELDQIGGVDFILDLDRGVVTACGMDQRIRRLREWNRLRSLVRLGEWLTKEPYAVGCHAEDLIRSVRTRLEAIER